MPEVYELKDIPDDQVEGHAAEYESLGHIVEKLRQPDGKWTIRALEGRNSSTTVSEELSPLLLGAKGEEVEKIQKELLVRNFSPGKVDGYFGEVTRHAVQSFQNSSGLSADGIAGPQTLDALSQDLRILERLRFSKVTLEMLRVASDLSTEKKSQVFSETLYYAVMCVAATRSADSMDNVTQLLASIWSENTRSSKRLEEQFGPIAKVSEEFLARKVEPFSAYEKLPAFSGNAEAILVRAEELAHRGGSDEIDTRHLVGGMLLSTPVKHQPFARNHFTEGGQDLEALKYRFYDAVVAGWPEEGSFWSPELGFPPIAALLKEAGAAPGISSGVEDPLLERLLTRQLAVSTVGTRDLESAIKLVKGPTRWGLGPKIERGDLLLIYFPKGLIKKQQLQALGPQKFGIRFILKAGASSLPSDGNKSYRQEVDIADFVELQGPIDPSEFNDAPLRDWGLPKQFFRRAGQQREPLSPELARALWSLVLERNPEQRSEFETLLDIDSATQDPSPSGPEDSFVMRNLMARDTWTTEDKLGYGLYAQVITDSIFNGSSVPPLTVGIQAPWGQGKTSLMRMIQERFDSEAPKRDLRKLETNGETAVASTYGHLRGWLSRARKWKDEAIIRTPPPDSSESASNVGTPVNTMAWDIGGLKRKVVKLIRRNHDRAPLEQQDQEQSSQEVADDGRKSWQTERIDNLPEEKGSKSQWRRPGILINKKRRIPTVWFNPLYYGTTEQIWAGLAHAMLQQLSSQIEDPIKREQFWFRLQLRRINVDEVLNDLRKAVWLRFIPKLAMYVVFGTAAAIIAAVESAWGLLGAGGAIIVGSLHLRNFQRNANNTWSLEKQFQAYVSEPDYRSKLGMLHWVDHDLDRALDLLCGDYPIAVFIDDLDRCDPKIVAEIIFAINQFISLPRRNVFFFLGMDTEMVASALEQARGLPKTPTLDLAESHQGFGWRFMEKFIQLPFVIPHLDEETAQNFAADRLGGQTDNNTDSLTDSGAALDDELTENLSPPEEAEEVIDKADKVEDFEDLAQLSKEESKSKRSQEDKTQVRQAISKKATELLSDPNSEEIARIVAIAIEDLELNPRSITRYFGTVRILRNLQLANGTLSDQPDLDRLLVLRAAHLLLNWPEALQLLQRKQEILSNDGKWVQVVSGLEERVSNATDWKAWSAQWTQNQPPPLPLAFHDHRLYAFLKKIADNPPGLSAMYKARFF